MRTNVYSDELTDRVEIVHRTTPAGSFIGVRLYIETPVTLKNQHGMTQTVRGKFERIEGDDDSSAVTFWAKTTNSIFLLETLRKAADELGAQIFKSGATIKS